MKIVIESTDKLVQVTINGQTVPARLWQGESDEGIPCVAFITRISPLIPVSDPRIDELTAAFDRDLKRVTPLRGPAQVFDLRFFID